MISLWLEVPIYRFCPHATLLLAALLMGACGPAPTSESTSAPSVFSSPTFVRTPSPPRSASSPTASREPSPVPTRPQPPAETVRGDPWESPVDGMLLLPVPAGDFLMGSDGRYELAEPDEQPQRRITLAGFWIDITEVTRAMYARCVELGPCPEEPTLLSPADSGPDLPQSHVSWQDASDYCRWAGRALPTEAQWERAARGHDGRRYPWGWIGTAVSGREVRLNFCDSNCPYAYRDSAVDDGAARVAPVGSYPQGASPVGALDMAGNVWEWVSDWYSPDYYQLGPVTDPLGPVEGRFRGIRGGSWTEPAVQGIVSTSRSANRAWQLPDRRSPDIGFRCAVNIGSP